MQSFESSCNNTFLFEAQHNDNFPEKKIKQIVSVSLFHMHLIIPILHMQLIMLSSLISISHAVHANVAQEPKNIKASPLSLISLCKQ